MAIVDQYMDFIRIVIKTIFFLNVVLFWGSFILDHFKHPKAILEIDNSKFYNSLQHVLFVNKSFFIKSNRILD